MQCSVMPAPSLTLGPIFGSWKKRMQISLVMEGIYIESHHSASLLDVISLPGGMYTLPPSTLLHSQGSEVFLDRLSIGIPFSA